MLGQRVADAVRPRLTLAALHCAALTLLSVLALAGVARVPVFVDEADNVLGACMMARGALIHRDFFSHHFPLPYFLLAGLGEAGACSVAVGRVLGGAILVGAGVVFAGVVRSRLVLGGLLVVTLAAPAYYLQRYLAETFVAAGVLLILALLTEQGRNLRGAAGHALRGVALCMLMWSSPIGLMMAVVTAPLLVACTPGARRAVVLDGAAALLLFPLVLLSQGTLGQFFEQAILFNSQIYARYLTVELSNPLALLWETLSFARHRFSFVADAAIGQETKATVETFTVYLELALLALLATSVVGARGERPFRLAICLLLPLTVARDGFHLSPFVALAAVAGAHLVRSVRVRRELIVVACALVAVLALRVYFFSLPLTLRAADELAASMAPEPQMARLAGPEDAVLYLPIAPHAYLAQERQPGSFYTFFLPWQADVPSAEERLIADIEARQVAAIYLDAETQVWGKYRLREYAPRLYAHILAAYRPVDHRDPKRARVFVRAEPG